MKPDYSSNVSADSATSYFGSDILGSVRSVTDRYGTVQADYSYDAFGSPYLGNLDNGMIFGYTGKAYDAGTGLYDYGFRDYSPVSARFTTVDPIRDGANWFAYVVNDPVNYVDLWGLEVGDKKLHGDITIGLNLNFVGMIGFDVSVGLVFDIDDPSQSGMFISGGFAVGASFSASLFSGYTSGDIEADNAGTFSIGYGPVGGNVGIDNEGKVSGNLAGSIPGIGIDAGINFSKQHTIVIPFATEAEKEKIMEKYYEHH